MPLRDLHDGKGWNEERSDDKEQRDAMANTRKNVEEEVENEISIGAAGGPQKRRYRWNSHRFQGRESGWGGKVSADVVLGDTLP